MVEEGDIGKTSVADSRPTNYSDEFISATSLSFPSGRWDRWDYCRAVL
jgi:hypothetical protein